MFDKFVVGPFIPGSCGVFQDTSVFRGDNPILDERIDLLAVVELRATCPESRLFGPVAGLLHSMSALAILCSLTTAADCGTEVHLRPSVSKAVV
jgi:hypothetical protein